MSELKGCGVKTVLSTFIPTDKNEQTRSFYSEVGFLMTGSSAEKVTYQIAMAEYKKSGPEYVLLT